MFALELLLLSATTVAARREQLKLPADSSRIQYQSSQSNPSDGGSTSQDGHNLFALFWGGNSISIYGDIIGSEKDINITLDNQPQTLDSRPLDGGLIWSRTDLAEGDHQLLVSHCGPRSQSAHGRRRVPESTLNLDYILLEREAVNDSAPNFEPAQLGTTPTSIPSGACLEDDTSNSVTTVGDWDKSRGAESPLGSYWYNSTGLWTSSVNSSLVFSFVGPAVWCYGTRYPGGGNVEVTIDGERVGSFSAAGYEQQYPLWSRQNLESCPHTLVMTTTNCPTSSCPPCPVGQSCPPCFDPCLSIDFFRFTDEKRLNSLGPGDQGMGPTLQLADILAGSVGGTLMLLIMVVAFLAWRVLFVLPVLRPAYERAVAI